MVGDAHESRKKWSMNKKKLDKTNFEKLFWRKREKNHVKVLLIFERLAFKIIFIWFPTGERANATNEKFFSLKVWSSLVWFTFFLFIFKGDLFFFFPSKRISRVFSKKPNITESISLILHCVWINIRETNRNKSDNNVQIEAYHIL